MELIKGKGKDFHNSNSPSLSPPLNLPQLYAMTFQEDFVDFFQGEIHCRATAFQVKGGVLIWGKGIIFKITSQFRRIFKIMNKTISFIHVFLYLNSKPLEHPQLTWSYCNPLQRHQTNPFVKWPIGTCLARDKLRELSGLDPLLDKVARNFHCYYYLLTKEGF